MRNLICVIIALHAFTMNALAAGNCEEKISAARNAYYNPKSHGFAGFTATIKPNWKVILGPTSTRQNLKVFQSIRFSLEADANGAVKVTRDFAENAAGAEAYIKEIQENLQRLVSGFFGIWSVFTITSPFPAESENSLKFENAGNECRVFYSTNTTDVVLAMTDANVISELKLNSPRARRTIKPVFEKTSEGLLIKGYHSLFEPIGAGMKSDLKVAIEYQEVDGIKLPSKLELRGKLGADPIAAELSFDEMRLFSR